MTPRRDVNFQQGRMPLLLLSGFVVLAVATPLRAQLRDQRDGSQPAGADDSSSPDAAEKSAVGRQKRPRLLIQPKALSERLGRKRLRVLDTRSAEEYQQGHLPGAQHVDVADWKALFFREGGMRDVEAWSEKVGNLGIGTKTTVVVYGGPVNEAARIWWTLKYLGLERVRLLDGGFNHWTRAALPVETTVPAVTAKRFSPDFQPHRLALIGDLKGWLDDGRVAIVDARSVAEFLGQEVRGDRGGHVPGARNLEWKLLLQEDGRFKSPRKLRAMFEKLGVARDQTVVTYCQSGGRAAAEAFALELAGYEDVRNYYCSWQEWSATPSAPVEGTEKR